MDDSLCYNIYTKIINNKINKNREKSLGSKNA
jgi:hypothetical protein